MITPLTVLVGVTVTVFVTVAVADAVLGGSVTVVALTPKQEHAEA